MFIIRCVVRLWMTVFKVVVAGGLNVMLVVFWGHGTVPSPGLSSELSLPAWNWRQYTRPFVVF